MNMNPAAEGLLGISLRRANNLPFMALIVSHSETQDMLNSLYEENQTQCLREVTWQLASGPKLTASITGSLFLSQNITCILLEVQPISRLLRISREENRVASQESSQLMLRGIAHEIKNPLGGIRGAAQLLAMQDAPQILEYTDVIVRETDRLRDLIDRLVGPRDQIELQSINIHNIVEHVAKLMAAEYGDSYRLVRDYDPSIPEFMLREGPMVQALINLFRNAVQAMLDGGTELPCITLVTRIMQRFTIGGHQHSLICKVSIADNGPGVPEDLQERIFLPLISGRPEGSGLGLSITQSIVHQHQGLIELDSQPGRTVFHIYLPMDLTQ